MKHTSAKVVAWITCLSALPFIAGLTGCAGHRYAPSTGQSLNDQRTAEPDFNQITDPRIEDSRTAERVREALAAGAVYKYDGVKVIASNGVVQLSGFVITSAQITSAEKVTGKVVGVKRVENNLSVKD